MKLPFKFFENKEPFEYYLALVLRNEKATAIVFKKEKESIRFINSADEFFQNTIEDSSTEELLNVLDKAITKAESVLPESIETHKTLLGLKESWIENDKIKKEYLEKLRKVNEELSLNPIGFLAYTESIISFVQKEEGAPITAVLADIGKKYITVSLIRAGKILETKSSEIHQSASFTVDSLLKHFQTFDSMPTRIIILDSEEDELTQEFLNHTWSKSLSFLHIPQITSLPEDTSVKAMLFGAATKMGGKILYEKKDDDENQIPQKSELIEIEKDTIKDVLTHNDKEKLDYIGEESSAQYFGFLEGQDVSKVTKEEKKVIEEAKTEKLTSDQVEKNFEELPEEVKQKEEKIPLPVIVSIASGKLVNTLLKVLSLTSKIKFNKEFLKNRNFLIAGGGILLLLILFLGFNLLGKVATVDIYVSANQEQRNTSVTFSPNSSTDISNSIISVSNISVSEEGSITENATGKKEVGDKAKGNVTIFNSMSSPVVFPSGTEITSSNNLVFTLDSSVTVASATGDIFSGTKPGTANVNVTAEAIGQEYNLPSGTKFSIENRSEVAAKNDNAFSGGTKKTVTVISKDDLEKALTDLPKSLEQKAKDQLKSKAQDGRSMLNGFIKESIDNPSFDKKEGDQAESVTLKGIVKYQTVSFSNKDIEDLSAKLFDIGKDQISAKNLNIDAKNIGLEKNGDITADITIKASIYPKINIGELANQIKGASIIKAKNIILNIDQVKNVNIKLSLNIPFFPSTLPLNTNKIKINVIAI